MVNANMHSSFKHFEKSTVLRRWDQRITRPFFIFNPAKIVCAYVNGQLAAKNVLKQPGHSLE